MNRVGLSPRVRGNPTAATHPPVALRSIPASAGEPESHLLMVEYGRVYPRECGGTVFYQHVVAFPHGLSPRVRGNLRE